MQREITPKEKQLHDDFIFTLANLGDRTYVMGLPLLVWKLAYGSFPLDTKIC